MKNIIQLLIAIGFLVFSSCGKDDDYTIPVNSTGCTIAVKSYNDGQRKFVYHYDDQDRLILREDFNGELLYQKWEYIYNGSKVSVNLYYLEIDTYKLSKRGSYTAFLYSNGSVKKTVYEFEEYDDNFEEVEFIVTITQEFKYDENGYLIENKVTERNDYVTTGESQIVYAVLTTRTVVDGNVAEEKEVQYDYYGEITREKTTTNTFFSDFSLNTYSGELYYGTPNKNMIEESKAYTDGVLTSHKRFAYDFDELANLKEVVTENVLSDSGDLFRIFYDWECSE